LPESEAQRTQSAVNRNGASDEPPPQTPDSFAQWGQLGAQEAHNGPPSYVWTGGRASDRACVGEFGLHLCRAADAQCSQDGHAPGEVWRAEVDSRSAKPVGDDQCGNGLPAAAQTPRTQNAVAATQRTAPCQSSDQRGADETDCLGYP